MISDLGDYASVGCKRWKSIYGKVKEQEGIEDESRFSR